VSDKAPTILGVHHTAFRCRDAEETRKFYQDILGLRMRAAYKLEEDPTSGKPTPFLHIFFEFDDGNYIAFFDAPDSATPEHFAMHHPFDLHYAMEVADHERLLAFKSRLEAHKLPVMGPIDHGFVQSIYFHDPNGLVMEFTCKDARHDALMDEEEAAAAEVLAQWTRDTADAKRRLAPAPAPAQAAE
jgi:catechol 2,3-dioxygenase-like lactoylglutathione lyase family enzyme